MDRAGMTEAFAAAQANRDKLNSCPRHSFVLTDEQVAAGPGALFGRKLECGQCGGKMDLLQINQYILGYEAAGGNANDIMPGFREDAETKPERNFIGANRK